MSVPWCSFIVAVYNREKYLRQCISSILAQTGVNFEIIIVDDGSTDNSVQIIRSFHVDYLKLFSIEHQGCWKAKNFGITQARGKFICFIDADDFISSTFLTKALIVIKNNPSFEYYYPSVLNIVHEDGSPTSSIWRYVDYPLENRTQLIKLFWEKQIGGIPHVASMILRSVFQKHGLYNDTFFNLSDSAYIISHALKINFFIAPQMEMYYNRQHPHQTNTNLYERMRAYSEILDEIINTYPQNYYLEHVSPQNSIDFYQKCVEKFMELSTKTIHKRHLLEKAEKYLRKIRINL